MHSSWNAYFKNVEAGCGPGQAFQVTIISFFNVELYCGRNGVWSGIILGNFLLYLTYEMENLVIYYGNSSPPSYSASIFIFMIFFKDYLNKIVLDRYCLIEAPPLSSSGSIGQISVSPTRDVSPSSDAIHSVADHLKVQLLIRSYQVSM